MKRKLLLGTLAALGGLTVVGSGFAAWYFNESEVESKTHSVNHHVTDLNEGVGTLTDLNKDQNLYLVLDQDGYANKDVEERGISLTSVSGTVADDNLGTVVDFVGANYKIEAADRTTLVNAGITTGTFKAEFTLTTAAATYIQFRSITEGYIGQKYPTTEGGTFTVTDSKMTYTREIDLSADADADYSNDFKFDTKTFADDATANPGENVMFKYVDGKKPTSSTEYNDMKDALGTDAILTLSYSFTLTLPNA